MGKVTDQAGIHYKMLNRMQKVIASVKNLEVVEASVEDIILEDCRGDGGATQARHDVKGIITGDGMRDDCM
jgi:tRNA U34 5-carboxymethylaminomethyl modifying enzyme MnmG/GidA